jgi:ectoine hydroxylase-related dioxygenase (phytanoyl-CoA dioxygenase family)
MSRCTPSVVVAALACVWRKYRFPAILNQRLPQAILRPSCPRERAHAAHLDLAKEAIMRGTERASSSFVVDEPRLARFQRDGFLVAPSFLDDDEAALLGKVARADEQLARQAASRKDGSGGSIRLSVCNQLEDDMYSAIVRCRRSVDAMERMLGGEVYHYHHKLIYKEAHTGGAWRWHQDYGYWYETFCLFPELASCMIAIDRADRTNGCLQVLKGSHLMGRLNHVQLGDQTAADPERVAAAQERLELTFCELEPGDAVFFHCNLLHRSDANLSERQRWAFIACYNAARNDPYKESRHPRYAPLAKWADSRVIEAGAAHLARLGAHTA